MGFRLMIVTVVLEGLVPGFRHEKQDVRCTSLIAETNPMPTETAGLAAWLEVFQVRSRSYGLFTVHKTSCVYVHASR